MRTCDLCGKANPENASYCLGCGTKLPPREDPKCPSCGHANPRDSRFCGSCRAILPSWDAPKVVAAPPPPVQEPRLAPDSAVARIWSPPVTPQLAYDAPVVRPVGLTVAGVLLLEAGIAALAMGIYDVSIAGSLESVDTGYGIIDLEGYLLCCGVLVILFGAASVAGGYLTLIQQHWTIALVCAILAMLSVGPYMVCFILGLIALIFIAAGRDEFLT